MAALRDHGTDLRCVVLSGAGDVAFGAGSDISEFPALRMGAEAAAEYAARENRATQALLSIAQPVLVRARAPAFPSAGTSCSDRALHTCCKPVEPR